MIPYFKAPGLLRRFIKPETLAPEQIALRAQRIEITLIPLIAIGIGWVASPTDPMFSQSPFPWLWFAPVLISLRYGVLPSLLSGIPIIVNWLVADHLNLVAEEFSYRFFFGAGALVLICGEFSDVWRDRNARMEETYLYVSERLSRLTKRHLLLNLSHDRLEQEMLARPGSLRDALARLRAMTIAGDPSTDVMPAAEELLQLLSQYVNLESAALYTVKQESLELELDREVALIGEPAPLASDDVLLRMALEDQCLSHIASQDLSLVQQTNQLVVAPLVAGNNTIVGVLAVTRMPFFSLNVENLQMMSVILAYYADNTRTAPQVLAVQKNLLGVPALFAEEFVRMTHMHRKVGISSHVVLMTFDGPQNEEIPAEFVRIKRGLDLYWQTLVRGKPAVVILMPFASVSTTEGFVQRIDDWLQQRFHGTLQTLGVHLQAIDFAEPDPLAALTRLIHS